MSQNAAQPVGNILLKMGYRKIIRGLGTTGLGTTGLCTTGLNSTGLGTTGVGSPGLGTPGLGTPRQYPLPLGKGPQQGYPRKV